MSAMHGHRWPNPVVGLLSTSSPSPSSPSRPEPPPPPPATATMLDHVLGRPSSKSRRLQVLAVLSFWSLYLCRQVSQTPARPPPRPG